MDCLDYLAYNHPSWTDQLKWLILHALAYVEKNVFILLVSFAQVTMMTNALRVVRITFLMLELHHSDGDKL